jgi:hypothetical protein
MPTCGAVLCARGSLAVEMAPNSIFLNGQRGAQTRLGIRCDKARRDQAQTRLDVMQAIAVVQLGECYGEVLISSGKTPQLQLPASRATQIWNLGPLDDVFSPKRMHHARPNLDSEIPITSVRNESQIARSDNAIDSKRLVGFVW